MRVAVVVNCLKMGGMERVAVNLSDAFFEAGHSTELIYLKNRKKAIEPRNTELPVHLFNLKRGVLQTGIGMLWFIISKLLNILFKKTFPLWFAYAEARIFKSRLEKLEQQNGTFDLIIFRGQGTFEHIWPIQDPRFVYVCENIQNKSMYKGLSRWIFSRLFNDRNVVCVSDGALESFKDMVTTHQLTPKTMLTISNPNDFHKIRVDADSIPDNLHHKPYILGLGRLVPQKNFSLLIDAYAYAISQYSIEHDLLIVGDGKERQNLETKVAEAGLADRVFFKGQQNNPFPWYKQADLFVLSSKFEGLGMVLIEALACKTKVVSTDSRGGVRQIMQGDLEPFLAQETPVALAEVIYKALQQPWDDAFNHYIDSTLLRFDTQTIVSQYLEHFVRTEQ